MTGQDLEFPHEWPNANPKNRCRQCNACLHQFPKQSDKVRAPITTLQNNSGKRKNPPFVNYQTGPYYTLIGYKPRHNDHLPRQENLTKGQDPSSKTQKKG